MVALLSVFPTLAPLAGLEPTTTQLRRIWIFMKNLSNGNNTSYISINSA